jgi:hypothetical protein
MGAVPLLLLSQAVRRPRHGYHVADGYACESAAAKAMAYSACDGRGAWDLPMEGNDARQSAVP